MCCRPVVSAGIAARHQLTPEQPLSTPQGLSDRSPFSQMRLFRSLLTPRMMLCRPEAPAENIHRQPATPEQVNGNPLSTPKRVNAKSPSPADAAGPPTPMQPTTATRCTETSPEGRPSGESAFPGMYQKMPQCSLLLKVHCKPCYASLSPPGGGLLIIRPMSQELWQIERPTEDSALLQL